jgi:hypothetical protein
MSDDGLVTEFPRKIPGKAVPIVFVVIGIGLVIGGLVTMDSAETARTGLLIAFGALGLVAGVAVWLDVAKKTKLNERIRVFGDRIEVATSAGVASHSFAELKSLEGKVTVYQQTGERVHSYKLAFASGTVELTGGGEFVGVGEQTGPLLAERTGRRIEPWL